MSLEARPLLICVSRRRRTPGALEVYGRRTRAAKHGRHDIETRGTIITGRRVPLADILAQMLQYISFKRGVEVCHEIFGHGME